MEQKPIKDFPDYLISPDGAVYSTLTQKNLTYWEGTGYYRLSLRSNGETKKVLVHRLLAEAFIENPLNLPTVNHKNGIRKDNRLENLEWSSYSDQELHKSKVINARKRGATYLKNGWVSSISFNKKFIYLGRFKTKLEAQERYFEEYVKLRGTPPW